jgi:hypothetical protein
MLVICLNICTVGVVVQVWKWFSDTCGNCTGRSTGQAYVQFATAELANKALDRNRWESHIISLNFDGFESLSVLLQALLKKLC